MKGKQYIFIERYIYYDGAYWINILDVRAELRVSTDLFETPETEHVYRYSSVKIGGENHAANFIYGKWNGSSYEYVSNMNNYLTYSSSDGYKISYDTASYPVASSAAKYKDKTATKFMVADNQTEDYYKNNPDVLQVFFFNRRSISSINASCSLLTLSKS